MITATKGYSVILAAMRKYKDVCNFDIDDFAYKAKHHLFGIELKETHGFNIDPKSINSLDYISLGGYTTISLFGKKYSRTISWSDDGRQPENELLLCISFPTGAYIFGDDYPEDLFKKLFFKLKEYNPKYFDSHNHSLYFSMNNAAKVFNDFRGLYNEYQEIYKTESNVRRINELQKELENLTKETVKLT